MKKKTKVKYTGTKWKELESAEEVVVPLEKLPLRKQVEHWRNQVYTLQDQRSLSSTEYRQQREEIAMLTLRCARYERLLDHLMGVRQ